MSDRHSDGESNSDGHADHGSSATPTVYLREGDVFGWRKPFGLRQWLEHAEIYTELSKIMDPSHITGLQRVRGTWRIHMSTIEDKVKVMTSGVHLRGKHVNVLSTFPTRLDSERTTRLRVKNIPLTVNDEDVIKRTLTLKGLEVISMYRERLRINDKLTNCENGDRVVIVTSSSLPNEPLPKFTDFGRYSAHLIYPGQLKDNKDGGKTDSRPRKCSKCLLEGHVFSQCPNEWVCKGCSQSGHKQSKCPFENDIDDDTQSQTGSVVGSAKSEVHAQGYTSDVASNPKSSSSSQTPSIGLGRGTLLQKSMGDFLVSQVTPNKDKPKLVSERSPPTPAEEYREKLDAKSNRKQHKNK